MIKILFICHGSV